MYNDCDVRCLDGDIFGLVVRLPAGPLKLEQVNLCICYYRIQGICFVCVSKK